MTSTSKTAKQAIFQQSSKTSEGLDCIKTKFDIPIVKINPHCLIRETV